MFGKVKSFFGSIIMEMKKVSWSSRSELISATVVTFFFVAILTIYVGTVDLLMSKLMGFLLK
ncbi:MAG: preprotein translocase subunit SecE [Candidatus Kaelpia aquatica]|nr:preprotein translocase subunit SecE [Candidatus Kaelpia aquatica]